MNSTVAVPQQQRELFIQAYRRACQFKYPHLGIQLMRTAIEKLLTKQRGHSDCLLVATAGAAAKISICRMYNIRPAEEEAKSAISQSARWLTINERVGWPTQKTTEETIKTLIEQYLPDCFVGAM